MNEWTHHHNIMTAYLPKNYFDKKCKVNQFIKKYNVDYVLNQYKKSETITQSWFPIINDKMYEKALLEFLKFGKFFYFPTKYIYSWIGIIMKNTAILLADTILFEKGNYLPINECENFLYKNYTNFKKTGKWKNCYQKLNQIGLYDWIQLPDKSNPFTDFAIHQLMKILFNYNDKTTPEDTFVIINSCLNVIHYRGDISSIFIKNGKKTLDKWK